MLSEETIVVDALLGVGKARPIEGTLARILGVVNRLRLPLHLHVIAVDLPTGLNPDTGAADPATVPAEVTVTLALPKVGMLSGEGPLYTGHLVIADIGIPDELSEHISRNLTTPDVVGKHLPDRPVTSNKGTFGRVLIAGGCRHYVGAPVLAALGAYRAGAGLVTLAVPGSIQMAVASRVAEATYLPLGNDALDYLSGAHALDTVREALPTFDALLIGPGMGRDPGSRQFLLELLKWVNTRSGEAQAPWQGKLVIDADALNLLAAEPGWQDLLAPRGVITPHPGEMARLLGASVQAVQSDRVGTACTAAGESRQVVVLKGAHTVVADPAGQAFIDPGANALLASAGTGDVLSGAIAGLLAQGMDPLWAAVAGVNLHSAAADLLSDELGNAGLLAGDLPAVLPRAGKACREAASTWRRPGRFALSRTVTWVA